MLKDIANKRPLRAAGALVLGPFLFGLTSGPLRECLAHPGHASSDHDTSVASHHGESHHAVAPPDGAHGPESEGCTCLSQCSVENAPYTPGAHLPAVAHTPNAPKSLVPIRGRDVIRLDRVGVPLARPPPAVV